MHIKIIGLVLLGNLSFYLINFINSVNNVFLFNVLFFHKNALFIVFLFLGSTFLHLWFGSIGYNIGMVTNCVSDYNLCVKYVALQAISVAI